MKLFPLFSGGKKILRVIFVGYTTILIEKSLDEVIDQRKKS